MPKTGDKYIIEIESVYGKLMECPAKDWKQEDPMKIQMDAKLPKGPNRLYKIKGFNTLVLDDYALDKLEKYEPESGTTHQFIDTDIELGDEVEYTNGNCTGDKFFVSRIVEYNDETIIEGVDTSGKVYSTSDRYLKRTGNRAYVCIEDKI
jgi:hypothetical protein